MADKNKRLMKCFNCISKHGIMKGFDYIGGGVCPKCGADENDPLCSGMVLERALIHYEGPHPVLANRGDNLRYCDGKPIRCFEYVGKSSGEWVAVTCPECLAKREVENGS